MKRTSPVFFVWLTAVLLQSGCMIQLNGPPGLRSAAKVNYADPVLLRRQVLLFGDIDEDSAKKAIEELLFLEGKSNDPIDLFLMTPGGDFKSALAIEHVIRLLKSPVNTYALSECNSGGALLLAGGTGKRKAFRGAVIVLHGLKVHGRPPPGMVDELQSAYTAFWRKRARLPESWLPFPHGVFHVLNAEEALQYGVVDELIER